MEQLLSLEFHIFFIMAVGFLIRKIHLAGDEARRSITNLVLYVALPCNIFASFLSEKEDMGSGDYLVILLLSIGIQLLAAVYGKIASNRETDDHRRSLAFAMICSNAGFLGNAIAEGLYGAAGLTLTSVYLLPQRLMIWLRGPAIYSGETDRKAALKKALTHPCIIACILGLIAMETGLRLPGFLLSPIQSIGRCSTPLIMMMIGMILADVNLKRLVNTTMIRYAVHRLLIMPLIVFMVCRLLPISPCVTGVSVLLTAMPAGTITTILAAKYDREPGFAAGLVAFSTLLSIPAILLWSFLLSFT